MGVTEALLEPVRGEARHLDAPALRAVPRAAWSDVVVHTGPRSARLAEQQHAAAFTVGRHIVFNQGRYDPASARGRALLAHELTHVQQQRRGGGDLDAGFRMPVSALPRHGGASEAHASAAGHAAAHGGGGGGWSGATAVGVARQDEAAEKEDWATFLKRRARSTVKSAVGAVEAVPTYAAGAVDSVTWIPYAAMDAGDKAVDAAGGYLGVSEEARGFVKNAVPGALAMRAARDYAKAEGLADPNSGVPSLTLAVGRGGDAVEGYVDDAFGLPKEEGFFTDRELSLLATTITIDVALSFVAVEEIVLALKVVGGAGVGKAIYDAVMANPQGFYRSRDFWVAIAQALLYLVGIGAQRLRAKIVMLVSTILSSGVALVSAAMKLAEDFARPDSPERDQALKADVKALLQVVVSAIRQFMTNNRAPAAKPGGAGGGKPSATPPAVDAKPAAPAKPSAPAATTDPKPNVQKSASAPAVTKAVPLAPVKKKGIPPSAKSLPDKPGSPETPPPVAPAAKKPVPAAQKAPLREKAPLPEQPKGALPEKPKKGALPGKAPLPEKPKKGALPGKAPLPEKPKKGALPEKPKKGALPEKPKKGALPEKPKKGALPEKPKDAPTVAVDEARATGLGTTKSGSKDPGPKKPAAEKAAAKEPTAKKPAAKKPAAKDPAAKKPAAKDPAAKKPAAKKAPAAKSRAAKSSAAANAPVAKGTVAQKGAPTATTAATTDPGKKPTTRTKRSGAPKDAHARTSGEGLIDPIMPPRVLRGGETTWELTGRLARPSTKGRSGLEKSVPQEKGMHRAHAWTWRFGEEAAAGIMNAPEIVNLSLQKRLENTIVNFAADSLDKGNTPRMKFVGVSKPHQPHVFDHAVYTVWEDLPGGGRKGFTVTVDADGTVSGARVFEVEGSGSK